MATRKNLCWLGEAPLRGAKVKGVSFAMAGFVALSGIASARAVSLDGDVSVDIPANMPMDAALVQFSRQSGFQLLFASSYVEQKATENAVTGTYAARQALSDILAGSGLLFVSQRNNVVLVVPAEEAGGGHAVNAKKGDDKLEQVVVTAQKRVERLIDVPIPVTAIDTSSLADNNQVRLNDYYTKVPGLTVTPGDIGSTSVTIRGLTTGGATNPTVGFVVDDMPFGASTVLGSGSAFPDFDPSDLQRVEVLRGPQGTLYGVGSLGGVIKYVTTDPSTTALKGRVQIGASNVTHGDDLGYTFRGSVNVPVSEMFAVRASGFKRQDSGYVDNIQTGRKGINKSETEGGRFAFLYQPSDAFSLKLSAFIQHSNADGSSLVAPALGDLTASSAAGTYLKNDIQVYSATMTGRLGDVELTSLSAYSKNEFDSRVDANIPFFRTLAQSTFGVSGALTPNLSKVSKFSQEVRMSAPLTSKLDWLLGAFGTYEDTSWSQGFVAVDPATGVVAGQPLKIDFPTTYAEYALFTNLTYHFTDRFDLQVGGRGSENRQSYSVTRTGPVVQTFYGLPSPLISPASYPEDNAFTYLVTPQFKITPDVMVYARFASGYRPGGPNTNSSLTQLPTYKPDTTENYEVGIKGSMFDRVLTYDASAYYIDWKDIQLQAFDPSVNRSIYTNASRAKSQGVEFSVDLRLEGGLDVATWFAWNDAKLTEGFPAGSTVVARSGDRLPVSPRISGYFSVGQSFSLTNELSSSVGAALSYVGERLGGFSAPSIAVSGPLPRQRLPSYTRLDLNAALRYQSWSMNLFANNLTNKRGVLAGDVVTGTSVFYIQPRTFGMSLVKDF